MSRHEFIDNDLKLFFSSEANEFKKKISKRVYSPWHKKTDGKKLLFLHMILKQSIIEQKIYDWKNILIKLSKSGYVFTSSDYFPHSRGRYIYNESQNEPSYFDMLKESNYLAMIKELHLLSVPIDESQLVKFIKNNGYFYLPLDSFVTDFFVNVGFNLETTLIENSINIDIKTLTDDSYDQDLLAGIRNKDTKKYQKEQLLKFNHIKDYLNNNEISIERANEIYRCFKTSYPMMNTYPEFKDKYLTDICIAYNCAKELKSEAFFMKIQVDLIKLLEEKSNIKFIQDHYQGRHRYIGEDMPKKNHWEL